MTDELNDLPEDKPKAARKTAAKKAVAKKAAAPKALEAKVPEPKAVEPKAAEPKSTAKKAVKKAVKPAPAAVEPPPPVVIPEPIPEPAPEPAPVVKKKAVAKKKSAKVAAEETPAAPEPEPIPAPAPAPAPAAAAVVSEEPPAAADTPKPKKKAARKSAAAAQAAEPEVSAPAPVAVPAPAIPAPAATAASDADGGEGEDEGDDEGDEGAAGSGTAVVAIIGADGRPSFPPGDPRAILGPIPHFGIGPDGVQRKLSKWERWKLRKERFKLIRQQKFQDRQGGRPAGPDAQKGPGPQQNGAPQGQRPERGERPERGDRGDRNDRNDRHDRNERQERPRPEPQLSPPEVVEGLLEISGKGFGFLRPRDKMYAQAPTDTFVTPEMVRQLGLREGVWIDGVMRRGPRGPQLMEITKVNGRDPDIYRTLPLFEELTAINPTKRYVMETEATKLTTRLIDYISPIGRGQRGLVVAPPRAGKTTFIQHIAEAVIEKYEEVKLILLLVDERPEEVTELTRALPKAEVYASNNDRDPREHIRMAHLAIERAKRLVEAGEHVFMVLDSITRLARASNQIIRGGKTGSGGVDSKALEIPRRMFAAARNTREAGSLTIIATALIETNSRADEVIFQEFKGTGNMELVLDRRIAQQYIYPAVDIFKSGTRREELLMPAHQLEKVHLIRRGLAGHKPNEAIERLIHIMGKFPTNAQMLIEIKSRE